MNKLIQKIASTILIAACLLAAGCGSQTTSTNEVSIGVTAGPQAEVMDEVVKEAAKQGIKIKVVEFNDYVQPNKALAEKDINMNSMQHQPYLNNVIKKEGLPLVSIGKTIILPMAVYSHTYKKIADIAPGTKVAIPNDPTNGARALLLLQKAGLITLKNGNDISASVRDVVKNPKNLKFIELDAAQIPRSLDDTGIACINTNYAIPAGLNPQKDSLLIESKDSPYANVFAVHTGDETNETYKKIVSIYQSEPIRKFINNQFNGAVLPAF